MRFLPALLTAIASLPCAYSILRDEAFNVDYHHALLGVPQSHSTFFLRPQSSSSASLLYTLSDKHVLGAVNPKDGSVVWRQALSDLATVPESQAVLTAAEGQGSVISAAGNEVSAWDAMNGQLLWTYHAPAGQQAVWVANAASAADSTDAIVLFSNGAVRRLEAGTGKIKWEYTDNSGDLPLQVGAGATTIYAIFRHTAMLGSGKLKVVTLNPANGIIRKDYTLSGHGDISPENARFGLATQGSVPFVYSVEKPFKALEISPAGTTKFTSLTIENNSGEDIVDVNVHGPPSSNAPAHILVHYRTANKGWAEVYHIDPKSLTVTKAYSLPVLQGPDAFASSGIDANTYFTRTTSSDVILYSSASHGILGRWQRSGASETATKHSAAEVVSRGSGSFAVRIAETSLSGEWSLNRNGETAWTRPEMLSKVIAAAWAEDSVEGALVHELEVEGHEDPLTAFVHRLNRHITELSKLPERLIHLPKTWLTAFNPTEGEAINDFFKGKKLIVATYDGQIMALDPLHQSKVLWRYQVLEGSPIWDVRGIVVSQGQATVFLNHAGSITVDAQSGAVIKVNKSGFETKGVAQIPTASGDAVIKTFKNGAPYDFAKAGKIALEGSYLVSLSESGLVKGWTAASLNEALWTFGAAPGFKITNAVARAAHDPIASIGTVLGDRSVLYKYVNPNLALLTSVSSTALTMYLIEAVTGSILFTATHEGVDTSLPIPSVVSENWLAYSFYGKVGTSETKAFQLVIAELYESSIPNDRGPLGTATNQSAFELGSIVQPHVISQSFLIPEQISSMAVTQTSQGITTRQLLCTLPETNSIVGIPRQFLDPRRPVDRDPNPNEREEGLFRYAPVLDFDPKWLLTHSQQVVGVDKMITTPTLLESTSMMFAFGHDIFGTRLNPSMAFDILGKGFNKISLLLTIVGLFVGVGLLGPIVRKKQVDQRWKM